MGINKQVVETVKTVVIVALVSGIVAFCFGMKYANSQNVRVESARAAVQSTKK